MPQEFWPRLRTYTVRAFDRAAGELTLDFVVHGDGGLAGPWARGRPPRRRDPPARARRRVHARHRTADWHLLAGDESALPAIAVALERMPAGATVQAFVEVHGPEDELDLAAPGHLAAPRRRSGRQPAGRGRAGVARARRVPGTRSSTARPARCKALRRYLRVERGIPLDAAVDQRLLARRRRRRGLARSQARLEPRGRGVRARACAVGSAAMRRVGIMGGTFDPIHHGHLVAASEVAARFALDEVIFVPTGEPWQKSERQVSPAEHRYLMAVIATASNPRFWVSRVDIDRAGPTYTVDTIRDIAAQRPGDRAVLHHRRRRAGPDPVVEGRRGRARSWPTSSASPGRATSCPTSTCRPTRSTLVDVPAMAISSSDCRDRVVAGQPVWYLVPDGVVQYINKHRLYQVKPRLARAAPSESAAR